jgi:hypothetical protein
VEVGLNISEPRDEGKPMERSMAYSTSQCFDEKRSSIIFHTQDYHEA